MRAVKLVVWTSRRRLFNSYKKKKKFKLRLYTGQLKTVLTTVFLGHWNSSYCQEERIRKKK